MSWFGNFDDHLFICLVSLLIKTFPGTPFGRSTRFIFQCSNSLYAFSISSRYFISLSGCDYYCSSPLSLINCLIFFTKLHMLQLTRICLKLLLTSWARNLKILTTSPKFSFCPIFNCSPKYQMLFFQVWLCTSV